MEPLQHAALLWVIGDQASGELPDLATDALVRGLDSSALRELAGADPDDFWRIKTLFEVTIDELGLDLPDEQAALWRLAKNAASEIVSGSVTPSQGACWIWTEVSHRIDREGDLRIFIGLGSEWSDHPKDRIEIERSIVEAARRLVGQTEPRRWLRLQARRGVSAVSDSGTLAEVAPADLPVSDGLRRSVVEWARAFDDTFETGNEGFGDAGEATRFVADGRDLVGRLQAELGRTWFVEYMPEAIKPPGVRLKNRN